MPNFLHFGKGWKRKRELRGDQGRKLGGENWSGKFQERKTYKGRGQELGRSPFSARTQRTNVAVGVSGQKKRRTALAGERK